MGNKIRVGILFGGKSAEHEVSLISARNVIDAIDSTKYDPVLIGITKDGRWMLNEGSQLLLQGSNPKLVKLNAGAGQPVALAPSAGGKLARVDGGGSPIGAPLDVVFPILHGPFGEDGTVQGLCKLAGIPFVGAGVLGSAVGMDKDVMKRLLRDADIPVAKFISYRAEKEVPPFAEITKRLGNPVFVKPANMGSSVGISKADAEASFHAAVQQAFAYDGKILVEETVTGREIECAVLGNDDPVASLPGEVIPKNGFYSYEAKYVDKNGAVLEIPAKLPAETVKRVQDLAVKTFKVLCCEGLGRVDFFLKDNGELLVNELNTIPGFTAISMYPKMWEASGIAYRDLIDKLIQLALRRFEREKQLKTSYVG